MKREGSGLLFKDTGCLKLDC